MPLGLMTGMAYEEKETVLAPGDSVLLHSDGIVEAHSPTGEMFGFPRLKDAVARYPGGGELIDRVLTDLREHTGPDAEQEDDITMVTLARSPASGGRQRLGDRRTSWWSSRCPAPRATSGWRWQRVSAIVGAARPEPRPGSSAWRPPSARPP